MVGAWGASCSPDKVRGEVAKVLGAGCCQSQVCTWSCLCTLPANLPHPPGSTYPTYPPWMLGFWFCFWFGLIFHSLGPWPMAVARVSALWMILCKIKG